MLRMFGIQDPGSAESEIQDPEKTYGIQDPGSRGQKGTGSGTCSYLWNDT
jgi:hypothetical protein